MLSLQRTKITGCTFSGNSAGVYGNDIYAEDSSILQVNLTTILSTSGVSIYSIYGGNHTFYGLILNCTDGSSYQSNTITTAQGFYFNQPQSVYIEKGSINYCSATIGGGLYLYNAINSSMTQFTVTYDSRYLN